MMLDRESQMVDGSIMMRMVEDDRRFEPAVSPERTETLRRAEEALQRAEQWAVWMEAVEKHNPREKHGSSIDDNTRFARVPLRSGRGVL